jgi:hypothetical protein
MSIDMHLVTSREARDSDAAAEACCAPTRLPPAANNLPLNDGDILRAVLVPGGGDFGSKNGDEVSAYRASRSMHHLVLPLWLPAATLGEIVDALYAEMK